MIKSYQLLKEYRQDPIRFVVKLHAEQGHRMKLQIFHKKVLLLSHPAHINPVLKSQASSYSKGRTTKILRSVLGNGLITNEGDSWRKQHKLIRPVMSMKSVLDLAPKIQETTLEFLPKLDQTEPVDSLRAMNQLTWRIILNTLFSEKVTPELDAWLDDILKFLDTTIRITRSSLSLPLWLPTPKHLVLKRIRKKFDEYVYALIEKRRRGEKKNDFLQLLIDASEEDNSRMSDREIRDEIMTFMMAGHETITVTMTWTLILLAQNPKYKDFLLEETHRFHERNDFNALYASPWHTSVIEESMRLWPAVWVFMRKCESRQTLDKLVIEKGMEVVLAPFLTHRSSDFWKDPQKFRPERFQTEEAKDIVPQSYFPFGHGPRGCIGATFANMEAKIILATILNHFDWTISEPGPQTHEAGLTLRPSSNIKMNFRRRV